MSTQLVHIKDIQALIVAGKKGDTNAWQQAKFLLNQLISQQPKNTMLIYLLACMAVEEGQSGMAICLLERIVQLQPKTRDAWSALCISYRREGFRDEATRAIEEALKLDPYDGDALNNLGSLHINEGEPQKAIEALERAVKHAPAHNHARWNLGLAQLEAENWRDGFRNYTWGLRTGDRMNKKYGLAQWWHGQPCESLVVYDEQGVGDSVMFASVLNDLHKSGLAKKIIIDCHPRLFGLIKRSFPWATAVYGTRKEIDKPSEWIEQWERENGPIEYKSALPELCVLFRQETQDFNSARDGYIKADPLRVQRYKQLIESLGRKKVILMAHMGGHKKTRKDARSIALDKWLPLFRAHPDAAFISCEYMDRDADYEKLKNDHGVNVLHLPQVFDAERYQSWLVLDPAGGFVAACKTKDNAKMLQSKLPGSTIKLEHGSGYDLDDFFAFLVALGMHGGLVVTVNNSTVHFAGSLGVPCYTLTPSAVAWRYGIDREDMVWYSSVRQFRQAGDDWGPTFNRLAIEVEEFFKEDVNVKGEAA